MKHATRRRSGVTLMETVLALGVLAAAVPMVFLTLGESGKGGMDAAVETRAAWVVPRCVGEIQASRAGKSELLAKSDAGKAFPPNGETWALVFAEDGELLGRAKPEEYQNGLRDQLAGKRAVFLASLTSRVETTAAPLHATVTIEYPAAAPAVRRMKLPFHTRLP